MPRKRVVLLLVYPAGGGTGETEAYGTWIWDEDRLELTFSTGENDEIILEASMESLTLEDSGLTFEKR